MKQLPVNLCKRKRFMDIFPYLPNLNKMPITGKNATLSYYYHYALMSVGGELMAAFETSLAPVALSPVVMQAMALGVEQDQITTFLLPVQANNHPIYNPSLDYSVYLSQLFFFVLFQVLILLITVYALALKLSSAQQTIGWRLQKGNICDSCFRLNITLYHYIYTDRMVG